MSHAVLFPFRRKRARPKHKHFIDNLPNVNSRRNRQICENEDSETWGPEVPQLLLDCTVDEIPPCVFRGVGGDGRVLEMGVREVRGPDLWPQFCHFPTTSLWARHFSSQDSVSPTVKWRNQNHRTSMFELIFEIFRFELPHFPGKGIEAQKCQVISRWSHSQCKIKGHDPRPW